MTSTTKNNSMVGNILGVVAAAFSYSGGSAEETGKVMSSPEVIKALEEKANPKTAAVTLRHKGIAFVGNAPQRDVDQCAPGQAVFMVYEPMVNNTWSCAWSVEPNAKKHYANHLYTLLGYRPNEKEETPFPNKKIGMWYLGNTEMSAEEARKLAKVQRVACAPAIAAEAARVAARRSNKNSAQAAKPQTQKVAAVAKPEGVVPEKKVVQCSGVTKAGVQCKNRAVAGHAFCGPHSDQATKAAKVAKVAEQKPANHVMVTKADIDASKILGCSPEECAMSRVAKIK